MSMKAFLVKLSTVEMNSKFLINHWLRHTIPAAARGKSVPLSRVIAQAK